MSINTSVTLYKNTGYDSNNIPDSMELLSSSESIILHDVKTRQTLRDKILVAISPGTASYIDYCIVGKNDTYPIAYWVVGYEAISAGAVALHLVIDAVTTVGALRKNSNVTQGWLKRATKTKEEIGDVEKASKITLGEPWVPSNDMEHDQVDDIVNAKMGGGNRYITSTVNLSTLNYKAKDYIDPETSSWVTVPELDPQGVPTSFVVEASSSGIATEVTQIAGLSLFDGNDPSILGAVNVARSLGMDSAVQDSYIVPSVYANHITDGEGFVFSMTAPTGTVTADLDPIGGSYVPENKKAALFHQRVSLRSTTSGDVNDYALSQIGTGFEFTYFADPAPWGKPYCRPKYVNGNANMLYGCTSGTEWQNFAIGYAKASGSKVIENQHNRDSLQQGIATAASFLPTASSAGTQGVTPGRETSRMGQRAAGISSATASVEIAGAVVGGINNVLGMHNASRAYDEAYNFTVPEIAFAAQPGLQNYFGNDFSIVRSRLTDNDTRRFDEFLHKYGESVDEEFTIDKVYTRSKFNYIQCERVFIDSPHPKWLREIAISQLEGGIRVWHTQPSSSALKIGGN